ncbi:hypothetical protein GCM10007893_27150 [Paracoccus marinus]|nr:hypothetical protein GCM10007893_27150 [Paracoccus marinus]
MRAGSGVAGSVIERAGGQGRSCDALPGLPKADRDAPARPLAGAFAPTRADASLRRAGVGAAHGNGLVARFL